MEYCKRKFLDMNIPTTRHNLHATIMIFDHGSDAARFPKSFKEDKVKHQDKGLFASPELPKCVQESQQPLVNPRHALDWPSYTMDRKTIKINWDKKIIHRQSTTMETQDAQGKFVVDANMDVSLAAQLLAAAESAT